MAIGLQIIVPGSDASASGLPKMVGHPRGFSSDGLRGLYLFESGVIGNPVSGPFVDSSGRQRTGQLFRDWLAPMRTATGVSVTDSRGFVMDTGIVQPPEFTIIACLRHTIDVGALGAAVSVPAWYSDTQNGAPASRTGLFSGSPRAVPGMRLGSSNSQRFHSVRDTDQTMIGALQQLMTEATGGYPAQMSVIAFGVSSIEGKLFWAQRSTGHVYERTDPDIATGYAPAAGRNMLLGFFPIAGLVPATAEIVGFAVYDKYLRSGWGAPAAAMAEVATARGVILS